MWLQHRVYKYSLKAQDSLSKSEQYLQMSQSLKDPYSTIDNLKLVAKYAIKGEHYKHLADIYQDKKIDLEEKLCNFTYRRV